MQALELTATGHPTANFAVHTGVGKPVPGAHQLLVRVHSAALNPGDYKMAEKSTMIASLPCVLGSDGSGTIEEVGPRVTKHRVGERICAFTRIGTPGCGTFAEYCLVDEDAAITVPDDWTFEQAAALPVGLLTAALALFHEIGLKPPSANAPPHRGEYLLVWGGATSVGHYVIQLAARIGFHVIAMASPQHTDRLRALGAEHVLDYHDADAVAKIDAVTSKRLRYAVDTVGPDTAALCLKALHHEHAVLATVAGEPKPKSTHVTIKPVNLSGAYNNERTLSFLTNFISRELPPLISARKLSIQPIKVYEGGLADIPTALADVAASKLHGAKAVVRIDRPGIGRP